jgi:hypothetical protein
MSVEFAFASDAVTIYPADTPGSSRTDAHSDIA